MEEDGVVEVGELFGDPEADVGGACDERGGGMRGVEGRERIGAFGDRRLRLGGERRAACEVGGHRRGGGGLGGAGDGGIAGAAAEVAGELVVMILRAVRVGGGHGGDEAGSAEAALGAVVLDHCALDRVQGAIGRGDALDGADFAAMQVRQQHDAGVLCGPGAVGRAGHHRAGAAIAFVAALLCSCEAPLLAQPVEHRGGGGDVAQLHGLSVEKKRDVHGLTCRVTELVPRAMPSMRRRSAALRDSVAGAGRGWQEKICPFRQQRSPSARFLGGRRGDVLGPAPKTPHSPSRGARAVPPARRVDRRRRPSRARSPCRRASGNLPVSGGAPPLYTRCRRPLASG